MSHYVRYGMRRSYRVQMAFVLVAILGSVSVWDLSDLSSGSSHGSSASNLAQTILWTLVFLWGAYTWTCRMVFGMDARNNVLTCTTLARSRRLDLSNVRIYSAAWLSGLWLLRAGRAWFLIMPNPEALRFAERLQQVYPTVGIRIGPVSRLYSGLHRRGRGRTLEEGDE